MMEGESKDEYCGTFCWWIMTKIKLVCINHCAYKNQDQITLISVTDLLCCLFTEITVNGTQWTQLYPVTSTPWFSISSYAKRVSPCQACHMIYVQKIALIQALYQNSDLRHSFIVKDAVSI